MITVRNTLVLACAILFAVLPGRQAASPLVNDEMLAQLKQDYSDQAYRRGLAINRLLAELEGKTIEVKLREVNRFFNQFD